MTEGNLAGDPEERSGPLFAGLAGRLEGDPDHRPPLILLHGLTFDRTMCQPAVAELRKLDRFWLNIPFVAAWAGTPLWLVFRHSDTGPRTASADRREHASDNGPRPPDRMLVR